MSIKVLADKVLGFRNGEKDSKGNDIIIRTKIGFNELPDWVAETPYFKLAEADGSLKAFTSSADSEKVLKEQEKLTALKEEIAALEEQKALLSKNVVTPVTPDPEETTPDNPADGEKSTKRNKQEKQEK